MELAPVAAGPGTVVLDIGGDIGAAVITAGDASAGRELEIRPAGTSWSGRHVAFHRRRTAAGHLTAAVFPQLPAGQWEVRMMGGGGIAYPLSVRGGAVTSVRFPGTD